MTKTVFMFSGQGSQYYGMGRCLLVGNALFRSSMHRLNKVFEEVGLPGVLDEIYREDRKASTPFDVLELTHPAILMIELSVLELIRDEKIAADYVLGASLGEYAAAVAAGVLNVEDLAAAVARQVTLVRQHCPPGAMLAVFDDVEQYSGSCLQLAGCEIVAINTDRHFVISGTPYDVESAARHLSEKGITHQRLAVGFGFHSRQMDAAAASYLDALVPLRLAAPQTPIISCAAAGVVQGFTPAHLWRMVRSPIRFRDTVRFIEQEIGDTVLVDLGPSGTLANFATQVLTPGSASRAIAVLNPFASNSHSLEQLKGLRPCRPTSQRRTPKGQRMRALVFAGQGVQARGMGGGLFADFPDLTAQAGEILGYSIAELCNDDPNGDLNRTEYTQPALFVVNALSYLKKCREGLGSVHFMAGHSLGEYNALFAAGAFDFKTGLRLVQRRGALMGQARDGGMAAVIGLGCDTVRSILGEHGLDTIDLANLNGPDQIVLAGPARVIAEAASVFTTTGARAYVPLRVGGAFHSRYMGPARRQFADFLAQVDFAPLKVPVIANRTGRPYEPDSIRDTLAAQLVEPVRWEQSIRFLLAQGVDDIEEVGPGKVLTGLVEKIRKSTPATSPGYAFESPATSVAPSPARALAEPTGGAVPLFQPTTLGSASFRQSYGVRFSYICGAMYRGIASTDLIIRASRAGILSFFGAGGLEPAQVEAAVRRIQDAAGDDAPFGVNLAHDPISPTVEERTVDVLLATGVRNVEASAFMKVTPALVRYRLSGLVKNPDGSVSARNRILAKLSRPEVAESFLSLAPERLIKSLERDGQVTAEQAQLAAGVPMADDVCVEGDSGGHTDRRDWTVLLPTVMRFRDRKMAEYGSTIHVRVGAAGGIATPETAAAAFLLGADFILTGSINLCTAESGMSPMVKTMLEQINVQDTDYAPAGDMFELGAQVQVLKRGVFFPARARKLYDLYRRYDSLDEIDAETRVQLETRYFHRSLDQVWQETKTYFASRDPDQIIKAESNPKHKMALVFRWYFGHSQRAAMNGDERYRLDFQVHCGPSLGAFNQWVVGTPLEKWQNRHIDDIAERIMYGAAMYLQKRFTEFATQGASR